MPLKRKREPSPKHSGLKNITQMVRGWTESLEKGNRGQTIIYNHLTTQGYQVSLIAHHDYKDTNTVLEGYPEQEATIFSPDILAVNENEIFFADAKWKAHKGSLGVVNKTAYESYWNTMQKVKGIGFKIYFTIDRTKEIYLLETLINPKELTEPYPEKDGRVCYQIPAGRLKNLGNYTEETP